MQDYSDQFLEEAAQPVESLSFAEVERVGRFTRRWTTNLPQWEHASVLAGIRARRYVDTPAYNRRAGEEEDFNLAGRWRQARAWFEIEGGQLPVGLYEELRYGYLQPPTVTDSIPKPDSVTDWTKLDLEARAFKITVFDNTNLAKAGENIYYKLVYPNVATTTVREFCEGLGNRSALTDPVFGKHAKITGTWKIRGVSNEDQGDASSTVICSLANSASFTPGEITLDDNWNETIFSNFYHNLPDYPSAPFPPTNVAAVDNPGDWTKQSSAATIYRIRSADLDKSTGLWLIDVVKQTAKPTDQSWTVPDRDGQYAEGSYANQTYAWTQAKANSLSALLNVSFEIPRKNEYNLYDGSWTTRPASAARYAKYYNAGFFYEYITKYRWDHGGRFVQEVWRITCKYRFGSDIAVGLLDFHNGNAAITEEGTNPPGTTDNTLPPLMEWSYFQTLGGAQYQFKRTIKAELVTKDITSKYEISNRYTTTMTFPTQSDQLL